MDVSCVKTGVKYLHHEAQKYDIGVYFEANGHGTVIFSQRLKDEIKPKLVSSKYEIFCAQFTESKVSSWGYNVFVDSCFSEKIASAATTLSLFIDMVNETIGDALSDLLIVETILHAKDWDLSEWEKLYDVLPYQMTKVTVEVIYKYLSFIQICQAV